VSHPRTIALAAAAALAGCLAAAPSAPGAVRAPRLWATVNVCDTVAHPDAIGIRGSMPGSGDPAEQMFMRFQVQYLGRVDRRWHPTGANGDSGFVAVGSGRFRARQTGRTFTITPPGGGQAFRLRGLVTFEWRRAGEVVRRERRRTTGRHPGTRGADPAGFSAPSCVIS
jgi:hypothetical protein